MSDHITETERAALEALRLTRRDIEKLEASAANCGMSVASYVRYALFADSQ